MKAACGTCSALLMLEVLTAFSTGYQLYRHRRFTYNLCLFRDLLQYAEEIVSVLCKKIMPIIRVTAQVCDLIKFSIDNILLLHHSLLEWCFLLNASLHAWKHGDDCEDNKALFITIDSLYLSKSLYHCYNLSSLP